ncbi:DUF1540 domain-containing protein [Geodermatophilus aquaeductus]|uniref:DUF1540 domain-containing protein n=1 Tax=Geodermatophilus aquaeductus TaxID=1564161 RepID=A0A521E4K0_9ACTN|nr:DUF1540 domain-containing protein [Geodermatophilus aquaeductus]SMO78301.1 protein of unknown function [Geodermatophilus aquaeductus]
MTTVMPPVSECTVSGCSYNDHDHGCHAFAITVSGHDGSADCGTFIPLTVRGGLPRAEAQVGACQRTDCRHNDALECRADGIRVGLDHDTAHCLTFSPA